MLKEPVNVSSPRQSPTGRAQLALETTWTEPGLVVVACGDVDVTTASLEAESRYAPETLLVDLSEVAFLATAGLSALVELDGRCRASGTSLRLVTSRSLRRIMLTGLEAAFTLYDSPTDAFSELAIS
jgi:anti-sigma B factor antagonist